MTTALRFLACALFLTSLTAPAYSQEGGATKENLDLPFDALGDDENDEDAPEIVTFYGQTLEADGFFYIIDKSGSMQTSGELEAAKREVIRNISEFSDRVQFGVFFFDKGLSKFPSSGQPAEANPALKSSAISYVNSMAGGSGTCQQLALSAALQMANQASAKRKVIVYLSDGAATCPGNDEGEYKKQTLAATAAQNYQRIQINTIGVLDVNADGEKFMKDLASMNGGTYVKINK